VVGFWDVVARQPGEVKSWTDFWTSYGKGEAENSPAISRCRSVSLPANHAFSLGCMAQQSNLAADLLLQKVLIRLKLLEVQVETAGSGWH